MKKIILVSISLLLGIEIFAQNELQLYNMDFLPQSTFVNPSLKPKTKFHFGVSTNGQFSMPFSYNNIVDSKVDKTAIIDATKFVNKIDNHNLLAVSVMPDVSIGMGFKRGYASLSAREVVSTSLTIPKDLFEFLIVGNGAESTIGTEQKIGNFNIALMHYREYAATLAFQPSCKIGFGGSIKYLNGYQNISTKQSDISITTDPVDYTLTLKGQYKINTSGLDSTALADFSNNPLKASKNTGFGVNLGAKYALRDNIILSASLVDLGFIKWNTANTVYENKALNNTFAFSGVDAYSMSSDSSNNYFDNLLDTIKDRFDVKQTTNTQSYTTSLNTKLYINGSYKLLKTITVGATASMYMNNKRIFPALSIFGKVDVSKIMQLQANVSMQKNGYGNIGLGTVINAGPLQWFFISDNILGSAINPKACKSMSMRSGLNIQWSYGKQKKICENL